MAFFSSTKGIPSPSNPPPYFSTLLPPPPPIPPLIQAQGLVSYDLRGIPLLVGFASGWFTPWRCRDAIFGFPWGIQGFRGRGPHRDLRVRRGECGEQGPRMIARRCCYCVDACVNPDSCNFFGVRYLAGFLASCTCLQSLVRLAWLLLGLIS